MLKQQDKATTGSTGKQAAPKLSLHHRILNHRQVLGEKVSEADELLIKTLEQLNAKKNKTQADHKAILSGFDKLLMLQHTSQLEKDMNIVSAVERNLYPENFDKAQWLRIDLLKLLRTAMLHYESDKGSTNALTWEEVVSVIDVLIFMEELS